MPKKPSGIQPTLLDRAEQLLPFQEEDARLYLRGAFHELCKIEERSIQETNTLIRVLFLLSVYRDDEGNSSLELVDAALDLVTKDTTLKQVNSLECAKNILEVKEFQPLGDYEHLAILLQRQEWARTTLEYCKWEQNLWEKLEHLNGMRNFELGSVILSLVELQLMEESQDLKEIEQQILKAKSLFLQKNQVIEEKSILVALGECCLNLAAIQELMEQESDLINKSYTESLKYFNAAREIDPESVDQSTIDDLLEILN